MRTMRELLQRHRSEGPTLVTGSLSVDEDPCCAYELITRMRLDDLAKDVDEMRSRIEMLLWGVVGTVVIEIVLRLIH